MLARALVWSPAAERSLPPPSPARFVIDTAGLANANGAAHELSPDGSIPFAELQEGEANQRGPSFLPDGTKVAFLSAPWAGATTMNLPNRKVGLFWAPADGSAQSPELLAAEGVPQRWSPDGAELVVARDTENSGHDLWVVSVADRAERRLIATRYDENDAELSPSGEWLAYVSDRTGRAEVYVQPYRGGAPTRVSRDGGQQPLWARDGGGVYYQSGGSIMYAALRITQGSVSVEPPRQAFQGGIVPSGMLYADRTFDVAPDGRLVAIDLGGPTVERVVVVQQWAQQAARSAAARRQSQASRCVGRFPVIDNTGSGGRRSSPWQNDVLCARKNDAAPKLSEPRLMISLRDC